MVQTLALSVGLIVLVLGVIALLAHYTFWLPWKPRHWPRVLMYHDVGAGAQDGMNIHPLHLADQLAVLQHKQYRFVTISGLVQGLHDNSDHVVALTFDDGFAGLYQHVLPLLKHYDAFATIYLAPRIAGITMLDNTQILAMQNTGLVEFGAHTMDHVNLLNIGDEEAIAQIRNSKDAVEQMTNAQCRSFAYPFGRYASRHVKMVREAGFESAVTTKKRIVATPNLYEIPRLSMNGAANALQFHIQFGTGKYRV